MPAAEIITIGTELLLGEIVDTNSAYLARKLRSLNVDVFRTSTVGDNINRIAEILKETLQRTEIIITTGGLGPTVDDPTRDAVALAVNVLSEFRPELWEQIVERMARFGRPAGENQKKQAYIPAGAIALKNPVGTAPAFIYEIGRKCIISLPGVPSEMEYLAENEVFPYLIKKYQLTGLIKARILHTAGIGESIIDEHIAHFEKLANPTVGLAAHYGQVDIRITAKADSELKADALIAEIEHEIRKSLEEHIYGVDDDTLNAVTLNKLLAQQWSLSIVEAGSNGQFSQILSQTKSEVFVSGKIIATNPTEEELINEVKKEMGAFGTNCGAGILITPSEGQTNCLIYILSPEWEIKQLKSYGGHPKNAAVWAVTNTLDIIRRKLN